MTTRPKIRIPVLGSTADLAGRHLYKHGPATEAELCLAVDFGLAEDAREISLQRALSAGWLRDVGAGKLDCSTAAKEHYDEDAGVFAVEVKPMGQIAAIRQPANVLTRAPLSRKNMPNSRGLRQDIPSWSVRPDGFCLKSVSGRGEA